MRSSARYGFGGGMNKSWEEVIESFRGLQKDWDSYGAEPPTTLAIDQAVKVLAFLRTRRLTPTQRSG